MDIKVLEQGFRDICKVYVQSGCTTFDSELLKMVFEEELYRLNNSGNVIMTKSPEFVAAATAIANVSYLHELNELFDLLQTRISICSDIQQPRII